MINLLYFLCWRAGKCKSVSRVRNLNCAGPENDLKFQPKRSRPGGSASFCVLNPMETTKQVGGRAEGASRGVRGSGSPPGEGH
eukprot:14191651-Alexandrium_andersonii.AAC.1